MFNPSKKEHFNLPKRQIAISRKFKYFNFPKMRYFNLPKMAHFNISNSRKLKYCHFPKSHISIPISYFNTCLNLYCYYYYYYFPFVSEVYRGTLTEIVPIESLLGLCLSSAI